MRFQGLKRRGAIVCLAVILALSGSQAVLAQAFRYQAKPRAADEMSLLVDLPPAPPGPVFRRDLVDPRPPGSINRASYSAPFESSRAVSRAFASEPIPPGTMVDPFGEESVYDHLEQGPHDTYFSPRHRHGMYSHEPYGEMQYGEMPFGHQQYGEYYDDGYGASACEGCCPPRNVWFPKLYCWAYNCGLLDPAICENLSTASGAQAFKGPVDRGVNGNFGFYKNVNWGTPLSDKRGIGFQLGAAIALSDFEGGSGPVNSHRYQYFVTTGLYHRPECDQGFQWGAVLDYLYDDFYVSMNLMQIRAELSFRNFEHEIGFWGTANVMSDSAIAPPSLDSQPVTWQTNNQYNLFYRCHFDRGGNGRMWVGLTDFADVIFGAEALAPLSQTWAIQANYNYLWPCGNGNLPRSEMEGFNVSVGLVWFIGYKSWCSASNPYRPVLPVADNGWLFIRDKRGQTPLNQE